MAHVTMKAGATFDLLSPQEHKEQLEKVVNDFEAWQRQAEGETITRSAGPFLTDSTGGTSTLPSGGGKVFHVPVGYDAFLTRLSVDYEGSTAASPLTCDLRVVADQNTPAALRSIINQIPNVFAEGKSHAPLFRGGQEVVVCLQAGPVSTSIYCTVQVLLTKRKFTHLDTLEG